MSGEDAEETGRETSFRRAFSRARLEAVEGKMPLDRPPAPTGATFEYRVEKLRGRKSGARLSRMGRKGWELVAVDGGLAYLRRKTR